jgi:hypothetical protein
MTPQIKITNNIGNTIDIPNELDSKALTYMSSNIAAGVLAVPVDNTADFTDPGGGDSTLLLLSTIGAENCEIVASASKTAQEFVTLATVMAHNRGDSVAELKWDQIVVSKSATIDGSYAVLVTQTIFTTQQNTIIYDTTGLTTEYYKIQWKNSITGLLSDYSTAISVAAYPANSVKSLIDPVRKAMGIADDDNRITAEFCISAVNDARKFVAAKLYGIRHAWQQEFEYPIKMLAGTNYVDLPTNVDFLETDQSVLAARLLVDNILTPFNMRYIDKRTWNQVAFSVMGGTTSGETAIGAVTVTLENVGDFPDSASGVAYVATADYDEEIEEIAYTGIDTATNQLTGVTGITRIIPDGTRVWSRPTISQPIYYTVFEEKLYFDRIVPDSMQGQNLYIDYYKKIDEVVSLSQELPEHYREIYKWYLRYAIKYRKDTSLDNKDPDLVKFEDLVQALFNNLYTGQDSTIITS